MTTNFRFWVVLTQFIEQHTNGCLLRFGSVINRVKILIDTADISNMDAVLVESLNTITNLFDVQHLDNSAITFDYIVVARVLPPFLLKYNI